MQNQIVEPLNPSQLEWYKTPKRPIVEILADMNKPIPAKYLDKLKDKGNCLYIPWYSAINLMDRVTGGHWEYEIRNVTFSPDRIFVVARVIIHAAEGSFYRDATGTEELKRQAWNKETRQMETKELAFGDPSSNAESMALRRACAKFGLALYLYDKD